MILLLALLLSRIPGRVEPSESSDPDADLPQYVLAQSQIDQGIVLDAYWAAKDPLLDLTYGYGLYRNKAVYEKMTPIQQGALLNTIVCENKENVHNNMKQICSENPVNCAELIKQYKLNQRCVRNPVTEAEKCICDPNSIALYCDILQAKDDISKTIKVNCERPFGDKEQLFWAQMKNFDRDYMDEARTRFENQQHDLFRSTMHRLYAEMKKRDIGFCLLDDQLKKAVLTSHPYAFCNQNIWLGKCMCDDESSAIFCHMKFLRLLVDIYAEEEMLDCEKGNVSSSTYFKWLLYWIILVFAQID